MTCSAQSATFFTMTLRNNDWLPISNVRHFAAKAFSGIFLLHRLDTTERIEVRNLKGNGSWGLGRLLIFQHGWPVKLGSLLPFAANNTKVGKGPFVTNAATSTVRH
jgi:hypothetical protein